MKNLAAVLAVLAALAVPAVAGADELITNGGFESPALPGGAWNVYPGIPGWALLGGHSIEIQNSYSGWSAFDGAQYVELDSYANSWMGATGINTVIGQSYHLSFAYSPRPYVAADSNDIQVFWEGSFLGSFTSDGGTNTSWTVHNYDLLSTSDHSSLWFVAAGTNDSLGGLIDGVSLTGPTRAVPEPATMILLGAGALGLALRRRKGLSA